MFDSTVERWPGRRRPLLRIMLFIVYFGVLSVGFLAFVEHHRAISLATHFPTELSTVKVVERGRTYFVSESRWHRIHLLQISFGVLVVAAFLVNMGAFPLRDWIRQFRRMQAGASLPRSASSASHSDFRADIYKLLGRVLLWIFASLAYLTTLWHAAYWLWPT